MQNKPEYQTLLELMPGELFNQYCKSLIHFVRHGQTLAINIDSFQELNPENKSLVLEIIGKYQPTILSNGNSLVILLTKVDGSESSSILKFIPDQFKKQGNEQALENLGRQLEGAHILQHHFKGMYCYSIQKTANLQIQEQGTLLLTPEAGKNLQQHFLYHDFDNAYERKKFFSIYSQMAAALQSMINAGVFFPDPKNTNWQYIEDTLVLADTKSLTTTPRAANQILKTFFATPPEFFKMRPTSEITTAQAEKFHVYGLGINMIESYSGVTINTPLKHLPLEERLELLSRNIDCALEEIEEPFLSFLQRCVDGLPENRPTLAEAKKFLDIFPDAIPYIENLKTNIDIAGVDDDNLSEFIINKASDLEALKELVECPHLKVFYDLVLELEKKETGYFSQAGHAKAEKVMNAFVLMSIEARLLPSSPQWNNVLQAFQDKRGFFASSSFTVFQNCLTQEIAKKKAASAAMPRREP